ncbi:uncharacterized protein LOC129583285 isoform X2 [Paramacrobiotus metropolitanus]|uniref:uncharacterized protein LOC129583285 isoform X2 n=1 Tax=Paramacrobiotus metropolitanus TaxID=2943436 RepID=UPI0024456451|nr:uncharacterized protein LOC129583285 isoform X2 [Paramacrobiotus metropolitanus]
MFTKTSQLWNAVDVVEIPGVVRRGIVVDKNDSGLLVDFGVKNASPELVPFSAAYRWSERMLVPQPWRRSTATKLAEAEAESAWVLAKLSSGEPWRWYHGRLLLISTNGFVVAQVQSGTMVVDVFPFSRVRLCWRDKYTVGYNDFLIEKCSVPMGSCWIPLSLPSGKNAFHSRIPLQLPAILSSFCSFDMIGSIAKTASKGISVQVSALRLGVPASDPLAEDEIIDYDFGFQRAACNRNVRFPMSDLTVEILTEVFSLLHAKQQVAVRRTCALWSSLIALPQCSRLVVISILRFVKFAESPYDLAACIFHSLTPATKYCVIMGRAANRHKIDSAVNILLDIADVKNVKLSTLVFARMKYTYEDASGYGEAIFDHKTFELRKDLQNLCDRITLKKFDIPCLFARHDVWLNGHKVCHNLKNVWGGVHVQPGANFVNILEEAAVDFKSEKHRVLVEDLAEWVGKSYRKNDKGKLGVSQYFRRHLKRKDDARFGAATSGIKILAANLGDKANLLTLRNCTITALLCLQNKWQQENGSSERDNVEIVDEHDFMVVD